MTMSPRGETAKIYQFPRRPQHVGDAARLARTETVPNAAVYDHGRSWYHEAAIQEDRSRKT